MAYRDSPNAQERFVALDGMRGVAALAVITDHVYSPLLTGFFGSRYLAVDFFFVLSGFVIAHVYAERLASGMSFTSFMRARIIRLYPLYLAGLALGASLAAALAFKGWSEASAANIAAATGLSIFMLPTPVIISPAPANIFPFNGPAWSLFFELIANAAFALLLLRLNSRVLLGILAVSAAGLIAITVEHGILVSGFNEESFLGGFPRVLYGFFAGVLVYRIHQRVRLPALPAWAAFALLIALLAMPGEGAWRTAYEITAALTLFPLLVAATANTKIEGSSARVAAAMGLVSYGVYVLHVPIRDWLGVLFTVFMPGVDVPGAVMVMLVALVAIAATATLHFLYDAPVRRWLSRPRRTAEA